MSNPKQVAVITGASSGIGKALAHLLASRGMTLALCDVDESGLQKTVSELPAGVDVLTSRVDVASKDQVFAFADLVHQRFRHVDYIFNNAGVALIDRVDSMELADFEWLMNINFWGVVYGCRAYLPKMLERNQGHIINISSLFGLMGVPAQSAYCAAKFAVRGYSESLHAELTDTGVNLSCVHPGGIATDIVRNARFYTDGFGNQDKSQAERGFDKMAGTSPRRAAEIIMRGVDKRRHRIIVGPDAGFLDRIVRLMPASYHRLVRWIMTKERKKLLAKPES